MPKRRKVSAHKLPARYGAAAGWPVRRICIKESTGGQSQPCFMWVPDVRSPSFKKEARRQSKLLAADPNFETDMRWIEAATRDLWRDLPDN